MAHISLSAGGKNYYSLISGQLTTCFGGDQKGVSSWCPTNMSFLRRELFSPQSDPGVGVILFFTPH